ncbi:hypothetical protein PCASD_09704 [Puccinia coronata f. sp. avenae]|uniref:Uncharacterized protein n=1 Tax=Puccinia coronata f. sp. avenae TaxID=200324 RepID=A0A2N5TF99_9BASI|nr:hypothetical protein PCASD_09704 [Puccinia coronata f. sp. avenae]
MSYASVLADNAPPTEQQPKPDQNLLEGQGNNNHEHNNEHENDERRNGDHDAVKDIKKQVGDPNNQAGAISLINVITLSATALVALKYWNKPHWDKRVVSAVIVGVSAIMGGQGYLVKLFTNPQNKH